MKNYADTELMLILIVFIIVLAFGGAMQIREKDEEIKILKQTIQEQVQEKEVYMKMLEERNGD